MADGRAFRRVTTALLAASLVGTFATLVRGDGGLAFLGIQDGSVEAMGPPRRYPAWWQDVAVPWSAGAVIWPVLPACLIVLASFLTGSARFVLRAPRGGGAARAEAARAIGCYVTAPLALLLPATVAWGALPWLAEWIARRGDARERWHWLLSMLPSRDGAYSLRLIAATFLAAAAIALTVARTGQWASRLSYAGGPRKLLAVGETLLLWAVGIVVLLGLLPWCIGFVWIVIDGLRG
jgi:hypothetical protein